MAITEQRVATETSLPDISLQAIPFTIKNTFVDVGSMLDADLEGDAFATAEDDLGLRRLVSEPALKRRVSECFIEKLAACSSGSSDDDDDENDNDSVDLESACQAWGRLQTEDTWEQDGGNTHLTIQAAVQPTSVNEGDSDDVDLEIEHSSWTRLTTGENWADGSEESDDCEQSSFGPSCSEVDLRLSPEQGAHPAKALSIGSLATTAPFPDSDSTHGSEASSCSPTPVNWASVHSVLLHNVPVLYTPEMLREAFATAGFGVSIVSARRLRPQEETVRVEFATPNQAWLFKCAFDGKVMMCLANQTASQPLQVVPCQGSRVQQQQQVLAQVPQLPPLSLQPPSPQQSAAITSHRSLGEEDTGRVAAAAQVLGGQSLSLGALPLLPRRRRKGMGSLIDIAKAQQMAASNGASGAEAAPGQQVPAQAAASAAAPAPASGKFAVCTGCGAKCKATFKFCSYCGAQMPTSRA